MFQSILSDSSDGPRPAPGEIDSALNGVNALAPDEFDSILPLAKQCLQSSNMKVRQDGIMLFFSVGLRLDSSKLLDPYIDDIGALINDASKPFRKATLGTLALTTSKPRVSPKAVATLAAHLDDESLSSDEASIIIGSLLSTSLTDSPMVQKVLSIVKKRSDVALTNAALKDLGLAKTRSAEAIRFIGKGLDSAHPNTREAAVNAVSRLDRDTRAKFAAQLGHIAADHTAPQHVRSQAAEALR